MQAYADGKEVEELDLRFNGCKWVPTKTPSWDWDHYNYRVKVAEFYEFYVVEWEEWAGFYTPRIYKRAVPYTQCDEALQRISALQSSCDIFNIHLRHIREIF